MSVHPARRSSTRPRRLRRRLALVVSLALIGSLALPTMAQAAPTTYSATKTIPAPPASNYAGGGGGDGWALAFSPTQVFNIFHHYSYMTLACHLQSDATPCWSPRTVQDGSGSDFSTNGHPSLVFDDATSNIYAFGTRNSDGTTGVVCIDTVAAASNPNPFCGFTPLSAIGDGPQTGWSTSGVSVGMLQGSRWFSFNFVDGAANAGGRNRMLCFDLSAKAACAGQPFAVPIPAGNVSAGGFPEPATAAIGSRLIVPVNTDTGGGIACFDANTLAGCTGAWPLPVSGYAGSFGSPYPTLDGASNISGFCLADGSARCYDLAAGAVASPPGLAAALSSTTPWNGPGLVLGSRVYQATGNGDLVGCYDFAASAQCPNFPHPTPGAGYIYTVNPDPARPTCLWVNADGGSAQIQNFDAYTGGGCGEGPLRVLASQFVVNQPQCVPTSYLDLRIDSPVPADYTGGTVAFRDGNGNPIPSAADRPIDATGKVDLTGLSLNTAAGLPQFLITLDGTTGSPTEVVVTLRWSGEYDATCIGTGTSTAHQPTSVTTSLAGGGQTGANISVPVGTAVTDSTTLTGANVASATGTVTYAVYSDAACATAVYTGPAQAITSPGVLPSSAPVTLNTAGTYRWIATYSGDGSNLPSAGSCGSEVQTVTASATPSRTTCTMVAIRRPGPSGRDEADVRVTAPDGLAGFSNPAITNGTMSFPAFTPGQTTPVIVTATKTVQGQVTRFSFNVTDSLGKVKHCT